MDTAAWDQAAALATQIILRVIDADDEGATVLVNDAGFQVTAQALVMLAQWMVSCVEEDMDAFRAGLTDRLQRFAAGLPPGVAGD